MRTLSDQYRPLIYKKNIHIIYSILQPKLLNKENSEIKRKKGVAELRRAQHSPE